MCSTLLSTRPRLMSHSRSGGPPQVTCLDLEPYMVEFASPFFEKSGLSSRIKPVIGPADETMQQLAKQGERYGPALAHSGHWQ